MKEREIDSVLKKAAQSSQHPDSRVLAHIADSMKSSMRPVRPLPSAWVLTIGIVLVCAAVSLAGAAHAGFFGFERMNLLEVVLIFPVLVILSWLAANHFVAQMIPGSRLRLSSGALLILAGAALAAVFASLFRDYHTTRFLSAGLVCLFAGLFHAIPAGLLSWLLLRRGFATEPVAAGLAAGTLAGLAGVGMLELHCPNFQAAHILIWHIAVIPVSAAFGASLGHVLSSRARSHRRR